MKTRQGSLSFCCLLTPVSDTVGFFCFDKHILDKQNNNTHHKPPHCIATRIKNQLVFRIRVIEKSGKEPVAIVALKGNAVLIDGIASVEEV